MLTRKRVAMKVNISNYKKIGRKIAVQIDNCDVWSLDHTLAHIIYPALLVLREQKQGVPSDFANVGGEDWGDQMCFDFYKESHNWAFDQAVKKWDIILDKMIWSFGELVRDDEESFHYGTISDFIRVKTEKKMLNPITNKVEALIEMVDPDPDSHYFDAEGYTLYQDRIQEGLELFGKYYRSLWN